MISSWRRRRGACQAAKKQGLEEDNGSLQELTIPSHFRCPISLDLMKDPVTLSTGITYDRESIEKWIEAGNCTCPITNQLLRSLEPIPNHTLRKMIQDWCVDNSSYGIERIPTPRTPVSSYEVKGILSEIEATVGRGDGERCKELVAKIKAMAKESERNKRCIVDNGTGRVLATIFESYSMMSPPFDKYVAVLEEILSALTIILPLDGEARSILGSATALRCMVQFLRWGDLTSRRNAVLVLKEAISMSDKRKINDEFSDIEGGLEALFKVVKEPICPTTTKASLMIMYHMLTSSANEKMASRLVQVGLVELLLEMLVDCDRSTCEKALGVLDGICSCSDEGREKAKACALTIPVMVKKLLRVSDLATEFSVSILWKLGKNEKREDGGVLVEALQVGAFQKLLLLLQVGCTERTKEKATEMLKMMNLHRNKAECIDSLDFKNLKRPF